MRTLTLTLAAATLCAVAAAAQEAAERVAGVESAPKTPEVTIFLPFDRVAFDAEGITAVSRMAGLQRDFGYGATLVVGHADAVGSAEANRLVSERRARYAVHELYARGVPLGSVVQVAAGETDPLAPTPDETPEPANRRVVITMTDPGALPIYDPLQPYSFPLP